MEKKVNAVLYAVPYLSRSAQNPSVEEQLATLRKYAEENGFVVTREYSDEQYDSDIRLGLTELLADARNHEFAIVLTYELSRLFTGSPFNLDNFDVPLKQLQELIRRGIKPISYEFEVLMSRVSKKFNGTSK